MLLVELVMQGMGPFPGTARIDLSEGFNLITGGNESGKTTIYNCLFAFLNIKHGDYRPLINPEGHGVSQASLVFKSKDGEKYKLVHDYLKGEMTAFKFNPSSETFDPIDYGDAWLKEFMGSESGRLDPDYIEDVFGLKSSALISMSFQPDNRLKTAVPTEENMEEINLKEDRLRELRVALKNGEDLSRLEDRMDEVQNKFHDLNKKMEEINKIEEKIKEVSGGLAELKGFADLPADMPELITAYEKREVEKGKGYRRLEDELAVQEEELEDMQSMPIYSNKIFLIGGALAVLANVIIFSIELPPMVRPLYWVVFLAGLCMLGYAIFKEIHVNAVRSGKEQEVKTLRAEIRKFVSGYEKKNAPFLEMVRKTSSKDPADMKKRYRSYCELSGTKEALEKEMGFILSGRDKKAIEEEYKSILAMKDELYEKMAGYAGMSTNIYEIKDEIERLEAALKPHWVKEMEIEAGRGVKGRSFLDIKMMLGRDFREVVPLIKDEARRYMEKLSWGRYRLEMRDDSSITLYKEGDTEGVMPSTLSTGAMTQLYISIRFAIFSAFSQQASFPLILDNPFQLLDQSHEILAVELLREISKGKQVILLSTHDYPAASGDHLVRI